jgi:drug/metabolite transporter (DMT)-like permease
MILTACPRAPAEPRARFARIRRFVSTSTGPVTTRLSDATERRAAHRKGLLLMIGAGLCWSTGGLLVRAQSMSDAWEVVLWRSVFMVGFFVAIMVATYRARAWDQVRAVGWTGVLSGALLASTFFFFMIAITRNPVANTLVLMSTGPFIVALAAWLLIGERVPRRTWIAIGVAIAGIVVMSARGLGAEFHPSVFLALGVPIAAGLNVVLLRHARHRVDMVPAVMIAGIISIVLALPLALPLQATAWDLSMLAIMGVIQLGAGCVMMTIATRYLPASEIGLLGLLETTLGPVWVWLAFGERPSELTLIGGLVVVGAVLVNQLAALRERRDPPPTP